MKLCECGCGRPAPIAASTRRNKGHVKGEPLRFVHGHQRRKPLRYEVDEDTGCWNWQGSVAGSKAPYGVFSKDYKKVYAHRHFYEQANGPIPEGMQVDHVCGNTLCVNPDHLEPVTNAENTQRGRKARITPEIVRQIRAAQGSHREIGARFGLKKTAVGYIRQGKRWANVA